MAKATLKAVSGYLPNLRFQRKVARAELRWAGLGGAGKGSRAVAGWDEDALTLAVEAARAARPMRDVDAVTFASTSSPFRDRSMAGLIGEALVLAPTCLARDVGNSRRAAVSALVDAFRCDGTALVAAGEKRVAAPGSAQHMSWGDGAGAAVVGPGDGVARCLAVASINVDLLDVYVAQDGGVPYAAEERFVRECAVNDVYVPAIKAALAQAGMKGSDIALSVVPEPVEGVYRALSKLCGLAVPNLCTEVSARAGELGAAMPLFGLALALDRAKVGDKILLAGFGNGADVLVLEVTGGGDGSATAALAEGVPLTSYSRFLSLTGQIPLDWGPRAEINQKVSATTLMRHGREMHGFVGGRDAAGNVQFPKTPMPVRPNAIGPEPYEDVVLRDEAARILSITADRLNFTPDPPFCFGLVQFENGARLTMEHCDVEGDAPVVGTPVRMRFRVKAIDRQRHFRSYFWKAAPMQRPRLPEDS